MRINLQEITLQPALTAIVEIFNDNEGIFVSTLGFIRAGALSPAAGIVRLKAKGAIIETITRTVIDDSGHEHKRVAHYKLVGWK